ncbi:MAG: DeoR/GlpR transcriptional regulator [Thermoflexus sp.]|uniref:DeoR/GlpR family DNA-binding transcription regulator n=1 Tax=Thermoflexus sp. TaxID=1969742 RepID=UPI0033209B5B
MRAARQERILQILSERSFITVEELAQLTGASLPTIRRDLQALAEEGLIVRTRGGASLGTPGVGHEIPYLTRARVRLPEKRAIARAALDLVREGEVLALDVGSTTIELARLLRLRRNLTVFTASLHIAQLLANSEVSVFLLGGQLRKKELSVVGPLALRMAAQFYYDRFFMGVAGLDPEAGCTDFSLDDVEVKKVFLERSREVIVLADHSKLGHISFTAICPVQRVHRVITDAGADPILVARLRELGVDVHVVPVTEDREADRRAAPARRS